jgi:YD repeat-containing protein
LDHFLKIGQSPDGYDNDGNLITLTDANSHTTQNVFDLLNQLTTETLPASGPSQLRSYDAAGNRLSLKDFNRTKRDNRVREKIVVEKRGIGFHRANGRRTGKENGLRTLVPHGGSK